MATLSITTLELVRTPANGHDDLLFRVVLSEHDTEETVYYQLTDTQANTELSDTESLIQRRTSGRLSNYGSVIEQVRSWPVGSFERPFPVSPDPG
jgi:hypothetical protein